MPLVTLAEYAKRRGVSKAAVTLAVQAGRISRRPDGKLDSAVADREWEQNTDATKPRASVLPGRKSNGKAPPNRRAPGSSGVSEPRTLAEALYLKEKARAMKAQLELQVAQGKLVNARDVDDAVFECHRRARDLLLGFPIQIANILAAISDPDECLRVLNRAVDDVCAVLAAPASGRRKRATGGKL